MNYLQNIKTIGRYEILKKLGEGGSGAVFLGKDPYIERNVAIKVYRLPNDTDLEKIEAYKKRFFVEAQSAGRLLHPNIVTIYDADLQQDFCYITMEYIDGSTLEKFCRPDKLLPVKMVLKIIFNVCKGLEYAHQNEVIHCDIKPSNIMLRPSGQVKITDFSIAYVKKGHTTLVQGLFGSPSYMSPEQVKEEYITERNDIFSLGSVLYELLSGQKAFKGENEYSTMYMIVNNDPVPILELKPELPKIFGDIINKALAKNPSQRYQSSMDFAYDLRLALNSLKETPKEAHDAELVSYIHSLPFFHNFTESQISEILSASTLVKIEKGGTIIQEGQIDDSFYILTKGKVIVQKGNRAVAVLERGECFGEMAYLTGEARSATIIANEECILLQFSSTLLNGLSNNIQLLFFKNFTRTIIKRFSKGDTKA
jgi:eukaryotic-like serine/threonine-protein kinase